MKSAAFRLVALFATYTGIMVFAKLLFLCCYTQPGWGVSQWLSVMWHGLPMDMTTAGYLSVIPGLLLAARPYCEKTLTVVMKVWLAVTAMLLSIIIVLDIALYGYWGFRLDATPLFYFASSPSVAMASARWWQLVCGTIVILLLAWGIYAATKYVAAGPVKPTTPTWKGVALTVVFTLLLFIPIRGSFTVATMNVSRAYFSTDRRLNHAAVDPAFSLLYSLTHANDFASMYRFMSDDEAAAAMAALERTVLPISPDSTRLSLKPYVGEHPDIYLIILESVSAHLMPSLGGDSVDMQLDSIANSGISFVNFYASSFRTDRAFPAILNAFPAQPSTSLTKYVDKLDRLPALSAELKAHGYEASFYYGGDPSFWNKKALLVDGGFDPIIHDSHFPLSQRTSKWGVNDGNVAQRVLNDIEAKAADAAPQFVVVQQLSSHEPFEVPYTNPRFADNPAKNAFAYSDSCLGVLVRGIEASPRGNKSVIFIVSDHLGAWPRDLDDMPARHHIPFVITGSALATSPSRISTLAGQTDIAPTILAMAGCDTSMFPLGRDLFDETAPRYVFFSEPGLVSMMTPADTVVLDCDADKIIQGTEGLTANAARAYLQLLYDRIANL